MTDPDYFLVFSQIGKLAKSYDDAAGNLTTQQNLFAKTSDQWSDGDSAENDVVALLADFQKRWLRAFDNGGSEIRSIMLSLASSYFKSDYFINKLVHAIPGNKSIDTILTAFQQELETDNYTISTRAGTGLCNFFDQLMPQDGTTDWPQDGSPTFNDSVFVVDTIVD